MTWLKRNTPTDTGTLNIGGLATGMTAGTWTLRRVGNLVYMNLNDATFTPTSGSTWQAPVGMIPVGFRPPAVPAYVTFPGAARASSIAAAGLRVSRYGGVDVYDVATKNAAVVAVWVTDDPMPAESSWPGVKL